MLNEHGRIVERPAIGSAEPVHFPTNSPSKLHAPKREPSRILGMGRGARPALVDPRAHATKQRLTANAFTDPFNQAHWPTRETRRALAEVGFIAAHLTDVSPLAPVRFIANARILLRAGVRCSSITDTHCDDDQDYR
jgi:hypothetical protein